MKKIKNIVFIGLLTFMVIIVLYPTVTDFSIYNPGWNGYLRLKEQLNAVIITENLEKTLNSIVNTEETALITVAYKPYSTSELETVRNYLLHGGTLILMDDYGYGNIVLSYLNVPLTIAENSSLLDPFVNFKNKRFPKAEIAGEDKYIILNHASAIIVDEKAISENIVNVSAYSSPFAYLDLNRNEVWDEGEPKGPLPVAVSLKYGEGTLIVISDPSIVINSMLDFESNLEFMENLVKGKKVFIDQTHIPKSLHEQLKEAAFNIVNNYILYPLTYIALLIGIAVFMLKRTIKKPR